MARLFSWVIALPLALLALVFAVANRHAVRLELWPLPWSADVPVYLVVLGALGLGLVVGIAAATVSGQATRVEAGRQRRRAESLERQMEAALADKAKPALPGTTDHAA